MRILLITSFGGIMQKKYWLGQATLIVKQEHLSKFIAAVEKIITPTLQEPGCIAYSGFQVIDEDGRPTNKFIFHEVWSSKEAMLVDHKENSIHMQKFFLEIHADTPQSFLESFQVGGTWASMLEGI